MRTRTIKTGLIGVPALLILLVSAVLAAPPRSIDDKIHKQLVTLPYYGVFDNLEYKIDGETVTLSGQVVRPSTRTDAARRVSKIEGIDRVINNIEVLPVSRFDDTLRIREYREVFRSGSLYRYALGTNPGIHIVVKNGHVTLEGVVASRMDSQLAYIAANRVPGVFSVTNNLMVE